MVVLGGGAVSYERGTPVDPRRIGLRISNGVPHEADIGLFFNICSNVLSWNVRGIV